MEEVAAHARGATGGGGAGGREAALGHAAGRLGGGQRVMSVVG